MDFLPNISLGALGCQFLVGLSRSMILFIIAAGLTLIFGVLKIINFAHGSLYMIGAFLAFSIFSLFGGGSTGFWLALLLAPLGVAGISLLIERGMLRFIYGRVHLMQILLTYSLALIFADLVKLSWGTGYKSVSAPAIFTGSFPVFGLPFPRYNLFLLIIGPLVAIGLWLLMHKTRIGKISRAAATDREMVGAVGINVGLIFGVVFVIGGWLAGLGGALIAPMVNITLGMDITILIEAFLIVIIGGLGNIWGALCGALIFGLVHAFGVLFWPQFAIVFPFVTAGILLIVRPTGLLKSTW